MSWNFLSFSRCSHDVCKNTWPQKIVEKEKREADVHYGKLTRITDSQYYTDVHVNPDKTKWNLSETLLLIKIQNLGRPKARQVGLLKTVQIFECISSESESEVKPKAAKKVLAKLKHLQSI